MRVQRQAVAPKGNIRKSVLIRETNGAVWIKHWLIGSPFAAFGVGELVFAL